MADNMLTTLSILLQSLGLTFVGMIVLFSLIKLLVRYFPEDK